MTLLLTFVLLVAVTATAFVPNNVSPSAAATTTATAFRRMVVAKDLSSNDEMKTVQEQLDEVKERLDKNDQLLDEMKQGLDEIDQRLDGIVAAFKPATKFALMETAVYTFVRVSQQHEHLLPKIQDSTSSLASCVLTLLLSEDEVEVRLGAT
jgi:tetrahydromethanopterin S-methyltransferase subunit G